MEGFYIEFARIFLHVRLLHQPCIYLNTPKRMRGGKRRGRECVMRRKGNDEEEDKYDKELNVWVHAHKNMDAHIT